MRLAVLASGSRANCIYIEGDGAALLVDAGLSVRETLRRLAEAGGDVQRIRGILVTHEHGDHIRSALPLARRLRVPLYGTAGTLAEFGPSRGEKDPDRILCTTCDEFSVGGFSVAAIATSHDAREPCGYLVREGDARACVCTDTGIVTPRQITAMRRCGAIVLESNHCPDMLRTGPYPAMLKRRISSTRGHLSNNKAAACIRSVADTASALVLAHLSEVNNTAEKALASARDSLGFYQDTIDIMAIPGGDHTPCWSRWIRI
jgi:phosphoribosyl 1,2-cyclic phosphodiesterase